MTQKRLRTAAVTMRVEAYHYPSSVEWRDAIAHDWLRFLGIQGFNICLIPNMGSDAVQLMEKIDLLILTGGDDLLGAQDPSPRSCRDLTERALLDYAIANQIPTLGVCRGMQAIQHYFGGSLLETQDISHVNSTHPVWLTTDGEELFVGAKSIIVNSFHRKAIVTLPDSLVQLAAAEDGTVEALRHATAPIVGVMWHPERENSPKDGSFLERLTLKLKE